LILWLQEGFNELEFADKQASANSLDGFRAIPANAPLSPAAVFSSVFAIGIFSIKAKGLCAWITNYSVGYSQTTTGFGSIADLHAPFYFGRFPSFALTCNF
jgi:hypothetical protein